MQALLLPIQKFVIQYKDLIIRLFQAAEAALVVIWLTGTYLFTTSISWQLTIYELGKKAGVVALGLYLLSLVPGILSRTRWFPLVGTIIMPFRRQIGILMFLAALVHFNWTTSIFVFVLGVPPMFNWAQIAGLASLLILLPLWLTSNDPSKKFLGTKWKMLHNLTHLAIFLIFTHLVLFQKNWMIPTALVVLLDVWSWIVFKKRQAQAPKVAPAATTPPMTE